MKTYGSVVAGAVLCLLSFPAFASGDIGALYTFFGALVVQIALVVFGVLRARGLEARVVFASLYIVAAVLAWKVALGLPAGLRPFLVATLLAVFPWLVGTVTLVVTSRIRKRNVRGGRQ